MAFSLNSSVSLSVMFIICLSYTIAPGHHFFQELCAIRRWWFPGNFWNGLGNDDVIEIEKLLSLRTKPRTVAEQLNLSVKTVQSYANNHRQRIFGLSGNVTNKADWDAHFNPLHIINFEDKDKAFVLAYRFASKVDDLIILFSTPRLMERFIQELDEGYRQMRILLHHQQRLN